MMKGRCIDYDPQLADEVEDIVDFDYEVDVDDVVIFILENCLSADEVEHCRQSLPIPRHSRPFASVCNQNCHANPRS